MNCKDISNIAENIKLHADLKTLNMVSSSVNHEMITPIKCVLQIIKKVQTRCTHSKTLKALQMVENTSTLLLNQVKGNLDLSLLTLNEFKP